MWSLAAASVSSDCANASTQPDDSGRSTTPTPTHSPYPGTPYSSAIQIGVMMFRGVGNLVRNRLAAESKNRILHDWHDKNNPIVLANLDFFDAFQKLLWYDDSLFGDFSFHLHRLLHILLCCSYSTRRSAKSLTAAVSGRRPDESFHI